MELHTDKNIILFDGICNLCNASIQLIIRNDSKRKFLFSPLSSDFSKRILKEERHLDRIPESLVFIENSKTYFKSTAALKIARKMDRMWPIFYVLILIPESIRNFLYDQIAKHRYRLFGKKNSCMVPSKEIESRFI